MSKQDWLEYFEAVNGRSATRKKCSGNAIWRISRSRTSKCRSRIMRELNSSTFNQPQQELQGSEPPQQPFVQQQNFQQPFAQHPSQQYQEYHSTIKSKSICKSDATVCSTRLSLSQSGGVQTNPFTGQQQNSGQADFNQQAYQIIRRAIPTLKCLNKDLRGITVQQQPIQPNEFSKTMKGFWAWLISAWKSPTSEVESSKINGIFPWG